MPDLRLVSIITPVYNGAAYIEALILSVRAQDYPDIEHIVIDDGSQDETVAVLERYPHLRWWSRENRGQYATMNEGLLAARGDLVCFISADDMMAPGAAGRVVQYLRAHPEADGVYGDYEYIDRSGAVVHPLRPFRRAPTGWYPYSLHVSHSSLYVRRKFLLEKDLFFNGELHYVGDYEWIVRILNTPLRIHKIEAGLSSVRLHEEQTTQTKFAAMRAEGLAVQRRLGISPLIASLCRKIMFTAKMADLARTAGMRAMLASLPGRLPDQADMLSKE